VTAWYQDYFTAMVQPYYADEAVCILHADCRDVLPLIKPASIDLVLTDPPYGHNNNNGDLISRWEAALGRGDYLPERDNRPIPNDGPEANELVQMLFRESSRLLKLGGCCCCGGGGGPDPQFARWSLWLDQVLPFKMCVIWDKGPLGMGWHYRRDWECVLVASKPGASITWNGGNSTSNVICDIPRIIPDSTSHPTVKPMALMQRFILWHTNTSHTVLDPFLGSGTTARAAKDLGRRCIGIEIEERYCEMAAKRMAQTVMPL